VSQEKVRVLVIDDSAFNRRAIVRMLEDLPNVEIVGYACDGEEGLRKVIDLKPDLITLDLEMPRMDGFTLLRIVMQKQPTPIIVVSSRADDENVFKALELGAVEFVPKPSAQVTPELMNIRDTLQEKVREVTRANLRSILERRVSLSRLRPAVQQQPLRPVNVGGDFRVVVIGSSTGGPPALQTIFSAIAEPLPIAFAVAQHMPQGFTKAFAERLNRFSALEIREAAEGDQLLPGRVLIAPGGFNLELVRQGNGAVARICAPQKKHRYVPSADLLFESAAPIFGSRLLGVVLTGMGNDGARGVKSIKAQGGHVIAEAEESCVVFGMPKETIATGTVDTVAPLPLICREILRYCRLTG
jgi:two-component system chemotaxis response regulator CheB